MKLLLVEDEVKTGDYVKQGLTESGFIVDLARNGLDGHHLALTGSYDLIILDVMLPDVEGWRIVQALREAKSATPVLFLTARDSVEDRVKVKWTHLSRQISSGFKLNPLLLLQPNGAAPMRPGWKDF